MRSAASTALPTIRRHPPNPDVHPDEGPLPLDLFAFGRGLAYAAVLALIGCCVFAALIPAWRNPNDDDGSLAAHALSGIWRVAALAPVFLLFAHLIRAYGQVRSFLDPLEPFTLVAARPVLFATTWGRGWSAQVIAAIACVPLAWLAPRRPAAGLALISTGALAVAITSPLTGHAVEHPWGAGLGVGLHALHLLGAGIWLGTLFCLVWVGLRPTHRHDRSVARMVNAFSPAALTGAGLAVTAGVLLGYAYVGDFTALWSTTYGRALLVKVSLLGVTVALGAWNWRRVRPGLGTAGATQALRRSATIEVLVGLGIIAATAVLVALPAPKL